MTYDSQRASFSKEHVYIVEIDLDYCGLRSGVVDPAYPRRTCSATETGDDKCMQTFTTCNDLPSYTPNAGITTVCDVDLFYQFGGVGFWRQDAGNFLLEGFYDNCFVKVSGFAHSGNNKVWQAATVAVNGMYIADGQYENAQNEIGTTGLTFELIELKTYRFCEPRSPHPIAINAIPSLQSVSMTPAKVAITGGMGERSSVSLTFNDHPHNDLDIDQYLTDRTYLATDRGTFWTKLRARNPNYQFRALRVLTGFLENGEYIAGNFKTQNYIIEKMDVSGGTCRITAKDPLKKASAKKAQIPKASKGVISVSAHGSGLTDSFSGSITLTPSGVGDDEYPLSGWVTLSGSEIIDFTRTAGSDDLVIGARGQYNTTAIAHSNNTPVQLCYQKTDKLDLILYDVLVNYAGINGGFISQIEWEAERSGSAGLDLNLSGLIAKPTDVEKIIKELSDTTPFFAYWDEFEQQIKLKVLTAPPTSANVFSMNDNLLKDSVKIVDRPELRASTVYFTFGQVDPTKSLTDLNNYTQTIVRVDTDSLAEYQSDQVKTVVSRWIASTNKTLAENSAQLYGRRFADVPREISFSVDSKDNSPNIGENRTINHRDMVDQSGLPVDIIFQLISRQESQNFNYKGLEYGFGPEILADNNLTDSKIKISVDEQDVDLYDKFFAAAGAPTGSTNAVFEVESGVVVGASSTSNYAMDTGATSWPVGSTIKVINYGWILGAGGDAGALVFVVTADGQAGGDAINMQDDMEIVNNGVIGGGGGGGATLPNIFFNYSGGGGGAGNIVGLGASSSENGTKETGTVNGGDLGEAGGNVTGGTGGAAGNAINKNGNTLTYDSDSDIRGTVA